MKLTTHCQSVTTTNTLVRIVRFKGDLKVQYGQRPFTFQIFYYVYSADEIYENEPSKKKGKSIRTEIYPSDT